MPTPAESGTREREPIVQVRGLRNQFGQQVVHDGLLAENGMVAWKDQFSREEIEAIRLYVLKRANEDKALEQGTKIARR